MSSTWRTINRLYWRTGERRLPGSIQYEHYSMEKADFLSPYPHHPPGTIPVHGLIDTKRLPVIVNPPRPSRKSIPEPQRRFSISPCRPWQARFEKGPDGNCCPSESRNKTAETHTSTSLTKGSCFHLYFRNRIFQCRFHTPAHKRSHGFVECLPAAGTGWSVFDETCSLLGRPLPATAAFHGRAN
jgi:hypothetical protein